MENTEKSAKLVTNVILDKDEKKVVANGKEYVIKPPTIYKLAGAARYMSDLESGDGFDGIIRQMKRLESACIALSYFINGDMSLKDELADGTLGEVTKGLSDAMSMLSIKEFDEVVNFGVERKDKNSSESKTIGNDTLVGQIASFMESLSLSYKEVVYEIPYRTLLLMSKDKARVALGDVYHETTDEEFFKAKGIKLS